MYLLGGVEMNLYEGIFVRKSVRNFLMEPVEQKLLDNILNFVSHQEMISEGQEIRYEIVNNLETKHHLTETLIGGKVPYYFLFYAKKTEDYLLNAGYLLEQIVLYMTTKGLGTCYLGMKNFKSEDEFEPIIAVAFGKPRKDFYQEERKKVNRKSLNDLCSFKSSISDEVKEIVRAGRMAPSAINMQPWRFVVYENRIHVFCRKDTLVPKSMRKLHEIDMGIVLAHLMVAAEEFWYSPELKKLPNISEQKFKQNQYIITVLLS